MKSDKIKIFHGKKKKVEKLVQLSYFTEKEIEIHGVKEICPLSQECFRLE